MATSKRNPAPKSRGVKKRSAATGKKTKRPVRRGVGAIIFIFIAILSIAASFDVSSVFTTPLHDLGLGLFGFGFYLMPPAFLLAAVILIFHDGRPVRLRVTCAVLIPIFVGALLQLLVVKSSASFGSPNFLADLWNCGLRGENGGVLCSLLAVALKKAVSVYIAVIVLFIAFAAALLKALNMTVAGIYHAIADRPRLEYDPPKYEHPDPAQAIAEEIARRKAEQKRQKPNPKDWDLPVDDPVYPTTKQTRKPKPVVTAEDPEQEALKGIFKIPEKKSEAGKVLPTDDTVAEAEPKNQEPEDETEASEDKSIAEELSESVSEDQPDYVFPSLDLLCEGSAVSNDGTEEMRANTARLNDTLQSFGIVAQIINVVRGPTVTRYELELDRGVKLSKVTGLADDIALSLGASGVRIAAIPDKISIVGIEVPNKSVTPVSLRDVLDTEAFAQSKSTISFAVGKDIGGNAIVGNIAKLPHLLIAGTTGSGKSVCINSLIVSMLYKATPEQVRMIMVDPKMVELGVYNSIPHLLIPVVTDPKKAAGALQWAVCEMLRRYRMMSDANVRDLSSYNKIAAANSSDYETMPQIVIIIDELADLMMAAAKEVEDSICRVAQMGRAAGIHLVIATQRPSADVITGLMKANIPSRIAFAVASAMESRIILDTQGAEKLVGKGDMLYAPLGQGKPKRVQGCFVSDEEVQRVVNDVGKNCTANYDSSVSEQIDKNVQTGGKNLPTSAGETEAVETDCDELLEQAVDIIMETGQASVSMLQRRLKLGYARAARIVDEMEERGIVGAFSGSKPRELLITKEQWEARKSGANEDAVEEELP